MAQCKESSGRCIESRDSESSEIKFRESKVLNIYILKKKEENSHVFI